MILDKDNSMKEIKTILIVLAMIKIIVKFFTFILRITFYNNKQLIQKWKPTVAMSKIAVAVISIASSVIPVVVNTPNDTSSWVIFSFSQIVALVTILDVIYYFYKKKQRPA